MTGVWHLYEQGERWRRPRHLARAVLETESHVAVCFAAPTVEVGPAADDRLAHLGPDLCHADVDLDAVLERVAGSDPSTEIAEVLLDQRLAAGIGNVYKNEVLWACEVSPFRPSPTSTSRCGVGSTKRRRAAPGQPRPLETPDPSKGLAVYNRAGQGCYRCLGRIRTIEHGDIGRRTWWCADCQT